MQLGIFITYYDIYSIRITFEEFLKILKLFNRSYLLGILIKVDAIFKDSFLDSNIQSFFIKSFFPPDKQQIIFRQVRAMQDERGRNVPILLFTRQGLHNLIKLTIFHCSDETSVDDELMVRHIGNLFLLINEFYDSLKPDPGDLEATLKYLVRNALYNSDEAFIRKISRYYKLFEEIPKILSSHASQEWTNDFNKITGLTLEELFAFGFAFYAYWSQINFDNLQTFNPFIDKVTYFQNTILPKDKIRNAFNIFCDDIDPVRDEISMQLSNSENWQLEFVHQKNKPLYEIPEKGIGNHGIKFLVEKVTDNIYWTMLDNLPVEKKNDFLESFGDIFEYYVFNTLKRIFGNKARNIIYQKAGSEQQACDCVVDIKRHIFIFEVKSGRLIKEAHLTGRLDTLISEFKRKLILRQVKQISKVIYDFRDGLFSVGNISYEKAKKIFPICVTLQEIPQLPPIREKIEDLIIKEGLLNDNKVQPFQIVDAEEVEILESIFTSCLQRSKFLDLISHKCGNPSLRSHSLKNFIFSATSFASKAKESEEVKKTFDLIFDKASQIMFGKNRLMGGKRVTK